MYSSPHRLVWKDWDGYIHEITFPSAEAAARVWRQMKDHLGMSTVTWLIEPTEGGQRDRG